ncbi:MAG TPA: hypothetical protein PK079_11725 [Leptospiraceae bacterium]|nr:hypothetical protein [Leptospiraceae bacterium]HMY33199.1 hypothetical protein [Leptospiraceae bacterium]HMZ65069.1 hypothetical protein [Leptospiraceae bacterium]HNA08783.1 hypothetical protein [Leptospiraceae bacterium]HNC01141.1 hypothetical protein [Leptospiraceae bacterium]
MIQELKPLSNAHFIPSSKSSYSNSDLFHMHKTLVQCAESFNEYLTKSKEPVRFTDNVVPLKKEFLKFIQTQEKSTLFDDFLNF